MKHTTIHAKHDITFTKLVNNNDVLICINTIIIHDLTKMFILGKYCIKDVKFSTIIVHIHKDIAIIH